MSFAENVIDKAVEDGYNFIVLEPRGVRSSNMQSLKRLCLWEF